MSNCEHSLHKRKKLVVTCDVSSCCLQVLDVVATASFQEVGATFPLSLAVADRLQKMYL